jgi:hypothetical protein
VLGSDNDPITCATPTMGSEETITLGNDSSPWCKAISVIGTVNSDPSFANSLAQFSNVNSYKVVHTFASKSPRFRPLISQSRTISSMSNRI